jgi:hypothetical protein
MVCCTALGTIVVGVRQISQAAYNQKGETIHITQYMFLDLTDSQRY